jgi:hypothetical protein
MVGGSLVSGFHVFAVEKSAEAGGCFENDDSEGMLLPRAALQQLCKKERDLVAPYHRAPPSAPQN